MSDGITDAHRENRFKLNFVPKTPPTQCKGCVFITCSPPDAQWECMNPIDTELLDKDGICIYHLTVGELAEYCRRRLMTKLKGGSQVQENKVNRPPCKWLHKNRDYANQWYCKHPKSMKPDAFKSTDYCLGCSIYEPCALCYTCTHLDNTSDEEEEYCKAKQEVVGDIVGGNTKVITCKLYEPLDVNDMSKDAELQCKHLLDDGQCENIAGFFCEKSTSINRYEGYCKERMHDKCEVPKTAILTSEIPEWMVQAIKSSNNDVLPCKHLLNNFGCGNTDILECPFTNMWDVAVKVCKGYGVKRRKYNVVDDNGERVSPISGPFDSEKEANKYIAKYIKVREIK